jgi:flagellin
MLAINTNVPSLFVQQAMTASENKVNSAIQRLSTGLRINSAADDAAGYAIVGHMTAQINGYDQAGQNANDGISLLQVANGAIAQMTENFQKVRTLAVQSANASYTATDRQALQTEVDQLIAANSQIARQTNFDGTNLLDGTFTAQQLQIGANANQTLQLTIPAAFTDSTGATETVNVPLQQASVSGQTVAPLSTGDLKIDGTAIGASVAGAQPGQSRSSAWAIANAINNAGIANLTATASTSISSDIQSVGHFSAGALSINGVALGAFSGTSGTDLAASLGGAVNAVSASTGVTATLGGSNSSTLILTTADGRNIDIAQSVSGLEQQLGLSSTQGTVTLTTTASSDASEISIGGNDSGNAGLTAGVYHSVDSGGTVAVPIAVAGSVADVSSAATAEQTISYIDTQLADCSSIAAYLGASQNTLAAIHSNLATGSVNLSAAQARIQDTDYAAATSALAGSQILQNAGTAMLAQANALPGRLIKLLIG